MNHRHISISDPKQNADLNDQQLNRNVNKNLDQKSSVNQYLKQKPNGEVNQNAGSDSELFSEFDNQL